eukprot:Hpha_TRINITY_DN31710_c0_g1::TRINITY_DN31710_c0_g1_i1::g.116441::m.116441
MEIRRDLVRDFPDGYKLRASLVDAACTVVHRFPPPRGCQSSTADFSHRRARWRALVRGRLAVGQDGSCVFANGTDAIYRWDPQRALDPVCLCHLPATFSEEPPRIALTPGGGVVFSAGQGLHRVVEGGRSYPLYTPVLPVLDAWDPSPPVVLGVCGGGGDGELLRVAAAHCEEL